MIEKNKKLESNDSKMENLNRKFDAMMEKHFVSKVGILDSAPIKTSHLEVMNVA